MVSPNPFPLYCPVPTRVTLPCGIKFLAAKSTVAPLVQSTAAMRFAVVERILFVFPAVAKINDDEVPPLVIISGDVRIAPAS